MQLEVLGLDHVYVTVSDVVRSEQFYDPVMRALGFKKGTLAVDGEPHAHYFNRALQYSLRPARGGAAPVGAYAAGALHHLCFRVADRAAVDEAHRVLHAFGVEASTPRPYPEYRADYYATFFADPDGIRLEVVCDTQARQLVRERWDELVDFVDPVRKLLEREAGAPREAPAGDGFPLGNLWHAAEPPSTGETFDEIVQLTGTKVERIVSSETLDCDEQDQAHDEWVVLLCGRARLEVAGQRVSLRAGDHLLLPAHIRHRVLETTRGALWLAVHVQREPPAR
ncbi:MAG TPA: VOC family protein [Polyangiaceae bacterium]|nr:VOC family protein [Polyangiaceae bacterium]